MWEFHPITVNGDIVSVTGLTGQAALNWFLETILDGLIPVWAPIGLYLNPISGNIDGDRDTRGHHSRMVVRNNSFAETPLEIVTKTYGMMVLGLHRKDAIIRLKDPNGDVGIKGVMDFPTMPVLEDGWPTKPLPVLSPHFHYCTIKAKSTINFFASMQTGYHSMQDNARLLQRMHGLLPGVKDTKYTVGGMHFISVASDHTLNNFLHVRSELDGGNIRVSYDNGFTPAHLSQLWKEAETYGGV